MIQKRVRTRPEFNQLAVFLKVVETRSFAAAARQLGTSQPSISKTIRRLEDIFGGDLFMRRRGGPLALTPIGQAVLPSARTLMHTVDQQIVRAIETAQSRNGALTLGFFPGLASGPLRNGIADFMAGAPDVHLHLIEGLPGNLHRQLNEGSIDLMVSALLPNLASAHLEQEKLWDEQLVVALRADHPMADCTALDWGDVAALPLILRTFQGELASYRGLLARVGDRKLDCEQHAVSRAALLDMVAMGFGATILFQSAVQPWPDLAFVPIHDKDALVPIEAAWPRADANPLRHRLLTCIRTAAARAVASPTP